MKYLTALSLASLLPLAYSTAIARRTVSDESTFAVEVQGYGTLQLKDDFSLCLQPEDESIKYESFILAHKNGWGANIKCPSAGCKLVDDSRCPVHECQVDGAPVEACLAPGSQCLYAQPGAVPGDQGCIRYQPHQGAEPSVEKIKKVLSNGGQGEDPFGVTVFTNGGGYKFYPFGCVVEN